VDDFHQEQKDEFNVDSNQVPDSDPTLAQDPSSRFIDLTEDVEDDDNHDDHDDHDVDDDIENPCTATALEDEYDLLGTLVLTPQELRVVAMNRMMDDPNLYIHNPLYGLDVGVVYEIRLAPPILGQPLEPIACSAFFADIMQTHYFSEKAKDHGHIRNVRLLTMVKNPSIYVLKPDGERMKYDVVDPDEIQSMLHHLETNVVGRHIFIY